MTDILETLNPSQRRAVMINEGSLLVFAGAGSGKTRVITTKIVYAIQNNLVKPYQILAVTFTNKACKEMQERVDSMLGTDNTSSPMIKTFHSLGVWLLRKYGQRIGIKSDFTIYDERESLALLCQCFPNQDKDDLKEHSKNIALMKEKGLPMTGTYPEAYEKALRDTQNIDFGDMIVKPIEILKKFEDVREEVYSRFKYILVDEYQDTNPSQLELLKLIKGPDSFICVVGDDDQSIYRFRSSDVKTILSFPDHFPGTQTVVLGINYRCSSSILAAAKDVIDHNRSRQPKNLTASHENGKKPVLIKVNTELDEADEIIKILQQKPCRKDYTTAILYRTNSQSQVFEKKLNYFHIPYQVVGDLSFYQREQVVDATALLKLVINRNDSVSFSRITSKLTEGFGQSSISKILQEATEKNVDILDACKTTSSVKGKALLGLNSFAQVWQKKIDELGSVKNSEFVNGVLKDFGLFDYYRKRDEKEKAKYDCREEDLNQFVTQFEQEEFSEGLEGIFNYLEARALDSSMADSEKPDSDSTVTLITMHRTKGLEFDRVFVTGLEDNVFFRSSNTDKDDEEEERRLVYVAMTRAKNELYLSTCSRRNMYGSSNFNRPVMFLDEIKKENLDVSDKRTYETPFTSGWGSYQKSYGNSSYGSSSYGYYSQSSGRSSNNKSSNSGKETYIRGTRDLLEDYEPPKPKAVVIKKGAQGGKPKSFEINDQVRNEIMGTGKVVSKKQFGSRQTIVVQFDNGKVGTYIEETAPLEKL